MREWFKSLVQWLRLSSFRSSRDEFYLSLAKSMERHENIAQFLTAELEIASRPATADPSKALALKIMTRAATFGDASFSGMLSEVVPSDDRIMLDALDAAKGSQQARVMRELAEAVRQQSENRSAILGALQTPVIVLPVVGILIFVIATESVPQVAKMAPPSVWTPGNALLRDVCSFIVSYGLGILAGLLGLAAFYAYQLPRWTGVWRRRLEAVKTKTGLALLPVAPWLLPLSLYRDYQVSNLLIALAVYLQSGASINEALERVKASASPWMRDHLRRVLNHLYAAPAEYVEAFGLGVFSQRLLARMATVIRNTPDFEDVLIEVGTKGIAEIRKDIKKTAATTNLVLLVLCGSAAAVLYIGNASLFQDALSAVQTMSKVPH